MLRCFAPEKGLRPFAAFGSYPRQTLYPRDAAETVSDEFKVSGGKEASLTYRNINIPEINDTEMKRRQHIHKLKLEQAKAAHQKRMTSPEYRARTHRLCNKGGVIESFYPETKELTDEEFYELVYTLNNDLLIRFSWPERTKEIIERRGKEADT